MLMQLGNVAVYGLRISCSGTCVYGLGLCSSIGRGLRDVAWLRCFLGLWV